MVALLEPGPRVEIISGCLGLVRVETFSESLREGLSQDFDHVGGDILLKKSEPEGRASLWKLLISRPAHELDIFNARRAIMMSGMPIVGLSELIAVTRFLLPSISGSGSLCIMAVRDVFLRGKKCGFPYAMRSPSGETTLDVAWFDGEEAQPKMGGGLLYLTGVRVKETW